MSNFRIKLSLILILIGAKIIYATEDFDFEFGVGAIAAQSENIYIHQKSDHAVFPIISLQYKRFAIEGMGFTYQLYTDIKEKIELKAKAEYDFAGYEGKNIDNLEKMSKNEKKYAGMQDRDGEIRIGLSLTHRWKYGVELNGNISKDVYGESSAIKADILLKGGYPLAKRTIFISELGLDYYSEAYSDHFFGVKNEEENIALGRQAYKGKKAYLPSISYGILYLINEKSNIILVGKTTGVPSAIQESPMVDKTILNQAFIMLTYKF